MSRALVIIDVQNDFCEGGSLAVEGGSGIAAAISAVLANSQYDHVVASRDAHRDPGEHFAADPDYVKSWPAHCLLGTPGSEFHPALDTQWIESVFDKGEFEAAYSAFEGVDTDGTPLGRWLRARNVDTVDLAGLATDYCVRATALDAASQGFTTTVLLDLTAGVDGTTTKEALDQLRDARVRLVGDPYVAR